MSTQEPTACSTVVVELADGYYALILRDDKPDIEFPNTWSFLSGATSGHEFPHQTAARELSEELALANGAPLQISLRFITSFRREDRPWTEHAYYAKIEAAMDDLIAYEGQRVGGFTLEELTELHLPPHQRCILDDFKLRQTTLRNNGGRLHMQIEDFYQVKPLGTEKDYTKLEQGFGFVLCEDSLQASLPVDDVAYIGVLTFEAEKPRGHHYHQLKVEKMVPLTGELECALQLVEDKSQQRSVTIKPGQYLQIQPGCIHTYTAHDADVLALEYAAEKFAENDTVTVDED